MDASDHFEAEALLQDKPVDHRLWAFPVLQLYCHARIFATDEVARADSVVRDASPSPALTVAQPTITKHDAIDANGDGNSRLETFWTWMLQEQSQGHDSDSSEDIPIATLAVREKLRGETFDLLKECGFLDERDKDRKWWVAQLAEVEIAWKEARKAARKERAVFKVNKAKVSKARKRKLAAEGGQAVDRSDDGSESGSESDDEVDYEKLDESEQEDEDKDAGVGGEMMDMNDAELDDEGIENISSDEDLYSKPSWSGSGMVRADSAQEEDAVIWR